MEIAKLERRKVRYKERSPSPSHGNNTILPTLPLPSGTVKLPPDSNAKLMFFTMMGLCKVHEDEKKGNTNFYIKQDLSKMLLIQIF